LILFVVDCKTVLQRSNQINDRRQYIMNQLNMVLQQQATLKLEAQKTSTAEGDYQLELAAWYERWTRHEESRLDRCLPSRWQRVPTGTAYTQHFMHGGNPNVAAVATVVADIVDAVDYIATGQIRIMEPFRDPKPIPQVLSNNLMRPSDTLQRNQALEIQLRKEMEDLNQKLQISEDDRNRCWKKMTKQKSDFESLPQSIRDLPTLRGFAIQATATHARNVIVPPLPNYSQQGVHVAKQTQAKADAARRAAAAAARTATPRREISKPLPTSPPSQQPSLPLPPSSLPPPPPTPPPPAAAAAVATTPASTVAIAIPPESTVENVPSDLPVVDGDTVMLQAVGSSGDSVDDSNRLGDSKYSAAKVRERIYADGSVRPVTEPKVGRDGLYQRPAGRKRKGMNWDAVRGIWIPDPSYRPEKN
jgi:hypothetical protein